jgi:hypothetical protein
MILEAKTFFRSVCRKAGFTPYCTGFVTWHSSDYEDKFAAAFLSSIRPVDCVWDIGANVGFYTEQ